MYRPSINFKTLLKDRVVLVVEPSINYRNSIKSFLTNLKVPNIRIVSSVKEAKRELLTAKVGLFIVEWSLSDTNGIQFCRELRAMAHHRDTPFLLLSVENLRSDVILASEVGIDGYLLKPFSYEVFGEMVEGLVRSHSHPTDLNQKILFGQRLLRERKVEEAEQVFKAILAENQGSARSMHGMGGVAVARKRAKEAFSWFQRAIQVNPDFLDAYRDQLDLMVANSYPLPEVLEIATRINELSPDNPKYTLILARIHLELGNLEQSEAFFKNSIRLSPKMADAYKGLGKINMIQEDYQSAMKNFRKALDLDNRDISILNSLGLAYVKLGKYQDGIDKYRAALQMSPHDPRILFNLGYAKEKVGEIDQAEFYYTQALDHDPKFEKAQRRLQMLKDSKNISDAS